MKKNIENLNTEQAQGNLPYTHCLNCGAELQGMYCHVCGQQATSKTPTISAFVLEYFNNAFIWDSQFLKTIWALLRRPGHLTNEYLAGKFTSQEHPLKLNMFLLFVFITLFVFFAGAEKMNSSVHDLTYDEGVRSVVQFEMSIKNDHDGRIKESPRDTVQLFAPLVLAEAYPEYISNLKTIEDTGGEALDKWIAVLPHVLIEEGAFVLDEDGYYRYNEENMAVTENLDLVNTVWSKMVDLITDYFPMLVLFTAPFLSTSMGFVLRKKRLPRIHHFIFALHYTAFLEFLMMCIYILHLTLAPSMDLLKYVMIIGSCVYLTMAFHRVYNSDTWTKAILNALFTSLIYFIIGLVIFAGIFLVACYLIADNVMIDVAVEV